MNRYYGYVNGGNSRNPYEWYEVSDGCIIVCKPKGFFRNKKEVTEIYHLSDKTTIIEESTQRNSNGEQGCLSLKNSDSKISLDAMFSVYDNYDLFVAEVKRELSRYR